jgi:acyl carrier protein
MEELIKNLKVDIIEQLNMQDIKPEDMDAEKPLFVEEMGLDSIDALELIVLLQKKYGIKFIDKEEGRNVFYSIKTMADYITKHRESTK